MLAMEIVILCKLTITLMKSASLITVCRCTSKHCKMSDTKADTDYVAIMLYAYNTYAITVIIAPSSISSKMQYPPSSKIDGFLSIALAIAILCFCPPLSNALFSPTSVAYPSANDVMKSCALAARAACSISASLAPVLPLEMLSLIVPVNRTGSCCDQL
jgi:hypothetical protein